MARLIKPASIRLEASSFCQLRCPCCPQAEGIISGASACYDTAPETHRQEDFLNPWSMHAHLVKNKIGSGYLTFSSFVRLVDKNPWIRHIELSNWGEAFLNPHLIDIMAYAHKHGIALTADNGVNFNTVSEEALEALVKYGFLSLSCSINGVTDKTYKMYSVGGDLEVVLRNIEKINTYKKKYKMRLPLLHWQFVIFGHNEQELLPAKRLAGTMGMYFIPRFNVSDAYSPVIQKSFIKRQTLGGYSSRREYFERRGIANRQKMICAQLWNAPQINWDGRLLGCCVNYWDDFGNVFDNELVDMLQSDKIAYARQMLLGKRPPRDDILCTHCIYYKIMRDKGKWLNMAEIILYKSGYDLKYRCIRLFNGYPLPVKYCI